MTDFVAVHRNALVSLLESVPGAGIVHAEEPYAKTQAAFQAAYAWDLPGGGTQLRGWFLHRDATRETAPNVGRWMDAHTWRIQGFMALSSPGSGLEFDALIEQIRAAYRADVTLGGASEIGPLGQPAGIQLISSRPVLFAGVLCHAAQLQLQTYAYF